MVRLITSDLGSGTVFEGVQGTELINTFSETGIDDKVFHRRPGRFDVFAALEGNPLSSA